MTVDGEMVETQDDLLGADLQVDNRNREGWVWVEPYWAPGTKVRVCGFDANPALQSESGLDCQLSNNAAECGCGPNLRWCAFGQVRPKIIAAMEKQVDLIVERVVKENRPYTDIFKMREFPMNGPLATFYKTFYRSAGSPSVSHPRPMDESVIPDIPFTDEGWVWVKGGDQHSGVLTLPAYLVRFQTNRARANQFYSEFRCQPFQPPDAGIEVTTDDHPDFATNIRL